MGQDTFTSKGPLPSVSSCPVRTMTIKRVCGIAKRLPSSITAVAPAMLARIPLPRSDPARIAMVSAAATTAVISGGVMGTGTGSVAPLRAMAANDIAVIEHATAHQVRAISTGEPGSWLWNGAVIVPLNEVEIGRAHV